MGEEIDRWGKGKFVGREKKFCEEEGARRTQGDDSLGCLPNLASRAHARKKLRAPLCSLLPPPRRAPSLNNETRGGGGEGREE